MREIAEGTAAAHGATAEIGYTRNYPATINTEAETALAVRAAQDVVGVDKVNTQMNPCMGLGRLRVHAPGKARLLPVRTQRRRGRRMPAAQPALRLQ